MKAPYARYFGSGNHSVWNLSRYAAFTCRLCAFSKIDRRLAVDTMVRTDDLTLPNSISAVSWASIAAGAVAAAALTLVLMALGAGLGLSSVSPWSDSGVSASTFTNATGVYLVIVAV